MTRDRLYFHIGKVDYHISDQVNRAGGSAYIIAVSTTSQGSLICKVEEFARMPFTQSNLLSKTYYYPKDSSDAVLLHRKASITMPAV